MAAPYVTGDLILAAAGVTDDGPTGPNQVWADKCAAAIEGAIATRLEGQTPSAGNESELIVAALTDGHALYLTRKAPSGIANLGPDGDIVRLGADALRALKPVIARVHETAGIGIG